MNKTEIAALLTVIVSLDRRKVGHSDVEAWLGTLGDLRFEESRDAAVQHYAHSTEWLMPAHIRRLCLASRQDTAMRALPEADGDLVSRPEWVTATALRYKLKQREINAQRKAEGKRPFYGLTVMHPRDGRP